MRPFNGEGRRQAPLPKPTSTLVTPSLSMGSERALQLLCLIARSLVEIGDKLDDANVLSQQEVDLLRRIVRREHAP